MGKTLSDEWQDSIAEAEAISVDVHGFKAKILAEYPGFSYEKLRADDPKLYKSLRRVEAKMDKAGGKIIFYLMDLNEKWWNLLWQGLVKQEQFGPEIEKMWTRYLKAIAH